MSHRRNSHNYAHNFDPSLGSGSVPNNNRQDSRSVPNNNPQDSRSVPNNNPQDSRSVPNNCPQSAGSVLNNNYLQRSNAAHDQGLPSISGQSSISFAPADIAMSPNANHLAAYATTREHSVNRNLGIPYPPPHRFDLSSPPPPRHGKPSPPNPRFDFSSPPPPRNRIPSLPNPRLDLSSPPPSRHRIPSLPNPRLDLSSPPPSRNRIPSLPNPRLDLSSPPPPLRMQSYHHREQCPLPPLPHLGIPYPPSPIPPPSIPPPPIHVRSYHHREQYQPRDFPFGSRSEQNLPWTSSSEQLTTVAPTFASHKPTLHPISTQNPLPSDSPPNQCLHFDSVFENLKPSSQLKIDFPESAQIQKRPVSLVVDAFTLLQNLRFLQEVNDIVTVEYGPITVVVPWIILHIFGDREFKDEIGSRFATRYILFRLKTESGLVGESPFEARIIKVDDKIFNPTKKPTLPRYSGASNLFKDYTSYNIKDFTLYTIKNGKGTPHAIRMNLPYIISEAYHYYMSILECCERRRSKYPDERVIVLTKDKNLIQHCENKNCDHTSTDDFLIKLNIVVSKPYIRKRNFEELPIHGAKILLFIVDTSTWIRGINGLEIAMNHKQYRFHNYVKIHIPNIVSSELNDLSGKCIEGSEEAKKAIKMIEDIENEDKTRTIEMKKIVPEEKEQSDLYTDHWNKRVFTKRNDDKILTACEYWKKKAPIYEVFLLTTDRNLACKALVIGVPFIHPRKKEGPHSLEHLMNYKGKTNYRPSS